MNNFDNAARTWDENPIHLERSQAIALKIEKMLPLQKDMKALEYGAGTGILSFILSEKLGHITMMDSSEGMVKVMKEKVLQRKTANLSPVYFNLEHEILDSAYDFIFNQMVLHHIVNISSLFKKFYRLLLPGGFLAIADLFPEDGSFHGDGFDGHKGFDPGHLKVQLQKAGFKEVSYGECYTVKRMLPEGDTQSFPIFLLTASK